MTSNNERQELSTFIKQVHRSLRVQSAKLGADQAWSSHCHDSETLAKYAEYMQTLATAYWEDSSSSAEYLANSRIEWIVNQCNEYFFKGGLEKQRIREQKILDVMQIKSVFDQFPIISKIKLLDVGSCYNPFSKYDFFDVTAIDIAPAKEDVFKCDFTTVNVVAKKTDVDTVPNSITELLEDSFHVVVFCLLLDYLPSPDLRLVACKKAYSLLKPEGILVIISPDSKHVGANAKLMKSWRFTLSSIGFSRIKYEKLSHIHCMVFRKSISCEVPQRWSQIHENEGLKLELNIPQDFTDYAEDENISKRDLDQNRNSDEVKTMFQELPDF